VCCMRVCLAEETAMTTPLKKVQERNHRVTALKALYQDRALDCARAVELTTDPQLRELYLRLAREWSKAAAALEAQQNIEGRAQASSTSANRVSKPSTGKNKRRGRSALLL
jgi:hypothetical protein